MNEIIFIMSGGLPGLAPESNGSIQFLPPGEQVFIPGRIDYEENEDEQQLRINVTAQTAASLQRILSQAIGDWQNGKSPRPWIDENHTNQKAVGFPVEFYWGGDDAKTGGVRLRVDWNGYGSELVRNKTYSYFSPALLMEKAPDGGFHKIMGFMNCLGGLVNEPAFRSIQQIYARGKAPAQTNQKTNHMEELNKTIAALGSAVDALNKRLEAIEQEQATNKTVLAESNAGVKALQERLDKQATEAARAAAVAIVASAVQSGRLAPQDQETQKNWTDMIAADPSKAALLQKIPANPALKTVTAGGKCDSNTEKPEDKNALAAKIRATAEALMKETKKDFQTCWAMAEKKHSACQ